MYPLPWQPNLDANYCLLVAAAHLKQQNQFCGKFSRAKSYKYETAVSRRWELTRGAFVVDAGGWGAHDEAGQAQKAEPIRADECVSPVRVQRRDCGSSHTSFVPGGWCWLPLFPWMGSQPGSLWLCGGGRADQSRTVEGGAEVKGGGAWDEGRRDIMEQWKIPKRDRRMPLLFLSSFSLLLPDSHFCSVH